MCRHLGYVGAPRTLHELIVAPEHSLLRQSYEPRRQQHGLVNVDGFGVGWFTPVRDEPVRYRRAQPIWTDPSFLDLATVTSSTAVIAAVRSASPGFAANEAATAPFKDGTWLFSHNGSVQEWERLADALPREEVVALEARVDSAYVWAMVRLRLADGAEPGEALSDEVREVTRITPARLNLLLTDGHRLAATAFGSSLAWRVFCGDGMITDGVVVASEPDDDGVGWHDVADGSLVVVDGMSVTITEIA